MPEKSIIFDQFEFPIIDGFNYLMNEQIPNSDYLFVNEPNDYFSIYFEKNFPVFKVPDKLERDYCLFQIKKSNRIIKFFCPEKQKKISNVVWYFYVELTDNNGQLHVLPGQVRVVYDNKDFLLKKMDSIIHILEQVNISNTLIKNL